MSTNAGIVSDVLKYVKQKTEQVSELNTLQGLDAMSTYTLDDGLGLNALSDSEKYKKGIRENTTGRTRTLGIWQSCPDCGL
jgi:hypothetical protein